MPSSGNPYDTSFFDRTESDAARSADIILPIAFEWTGRPRSVVDVGCGTGAWLDACRRLGVDRVLGIDGNYVDREQLRIPTDSFVPMDLAAPRPWSERFDLAMSLEVAEHLPATAADRFIRFLTNLSDRVLFSAAIPGQGGVNHLNEQPPGYWREHFHHHGFLLLDAIRPRIWHNLAVARFYSQNLFLYVRSSVVESDARLMLEHERASRQRLTIIYDDIAFGQATVPVAFRSLISAIGRAVRKRLHRHIEPHS